MKLKEIRKLGIKYCEENNCNYVHIAHNDIDEFYLVEDDDKHTVYTVKRNGGLNAYHGTNYAKMFHKEREKRKANRRNDDKKKIADILNEDDDVVIVEMED